MSEWIECGLPFETYGDDRNFAHVAKENGGLVGMLIEVNGQQYLIGSINEMRGVCNDCTAFESSDIVVRYKRVWSPPRTSDER